MDWPSILALLGGVGTGLATVLVTWLRTRVGDVTVAVTAGSGGPAVGLNATNIRDLDAEGLRRQIADVVRELTAATQPRPDAGTGGETPAGEPPGDVSPAPPLTR